MPLYQRLIDSAPVEPSTTTPDLGHAQEVDLVESPAHHRHQHRGHRNHRQRTISAAATATSSRNQQEAHVTTTFISRIRRPHLGAPNETSPDESAPAGQQASLQLTPVELRNHIMLKQAHARSAVAASTPARQHSSTPIAPYKTPSAACKLADSEIPTWAWRAVGVDVEALSGSGSGSGSLEAPSGSSQTYQNQSQLQKHRPHGHHQHSHPHAHHAHAHHHHHHNHNHNHNHQARHHAKQHKSTGCLAAAASNQQQSSCRTPMKQHHSHLLNQAASVRTQSFLQKSFESTPLALRRKQWMATHEKPRLDAFFQTDDPVLIKWLMAMRFETELECITSLQARTLATDEHSAGALSIRNSQMAIQELRLESNFIIDYIDFLIESLPLQFSTLARFTVDFSELWTRLTDQTSASRLASSAGQTASTINAPLQPQHQNQQHPNQMGQPHQQQHQQYQNIYANQQQHQQQHQHQQHLTIINCTPRKSQNSARSLRPLDKLAVQIRNLCMDLANVLYECGHSSSAVGTTLDQRPGALIATVDNGALEASLRKLKELYGRFVEISIRVECANIVCALQYDFAQSSLNRLSSNSSLQPVRPFESSSAQLPLKWALIALWQLTKDDSYICRTLTEKWQASEAHAAGGAAPSVGASALGGSPRSNGRSVAKRLDYSTKYDQADEGEADMPASSLRTDFEKLYQLTCGSAGHHQSKENSHCFGASGRQGALSSALKSKQQVKEVSTIELLIEIIISQPNKHERVDMMNFIQEQAQHNKLIDLDEWDQSVSAAIYTGNQYKVAALRILNHLCINDQAVKTILKCFSTPPPAPGQPAPENKIIRSIFECYQTSQEHIYQNETMLHATGWASSSAGAQRGRKRSHHQVQMMEEQQQPQQTGADGPLAADYHSDYGSGRQTGSNSGRTTQSGANHTAASMMGGSPHDDSLTTTSEDGDDIVVKEAIRLLVQLTTPFYRSNQGLDFYTLIGRFSIESLVKYLTNIIKSTVSREMLFLALTALANISFITTEPMKTYGTNRVMMEMFRSSKSRSKDLELRDQAVTILANSVDKNLLDVVNSGALSFLLSCLESCPARMANHRKLNQRRRVQQTLAHALDAPDDDDNEHDDAATDHEDRPATQREFNIENRPRNRRPLALTDEVVPQELDCACDEQQQAGQQHQQQQAATRQTNHLQSLSPPSVNYQRHPNASLCLSRLTANDLAAMERIHQKTAVAFARMSADPSTTKMVLRYGGVKQLIDLCKFSHKRNHSDTVLIACLAALRKMAKVIDDETFRYYNALDLIELELNQALEIYGSPKDRVFASDV